MAKNLKFVRAITDKLTLKGTMDDACQKITYLDEDGNEVDISVKDCLKPFAGKPIDFSVSIKTEKDLTESQDQED